MTKRRRRNTARDRGFSLVEVVITISLMGLITIPVMSAVMVSVRASATSRQAAQVETALVNAADRVNRAPVKCDYTVYAQAAVQTQGWAPSAVSLTQSYYVPGATAAATGTWAQGPGTTPACAIATPTDGLVQKIRIVITSPDGQVTRSVEVVKSDV